MVSSFRVTVINWLEDTIQADLYIRPANRINIGLTVDMRNELSALPQVKAIYSISTLNLSKGRYANASIVSLDQDTANRSWIWKANSDRTMEALFIEGWIFVSEPLMWRYNLNLDTNNVVSLPTDKGEKSFQVAGVFKDFTSDQGIIVMQADTFNRHWENRKLFGISVLLKDGVDPSDVIQAIHNRVKGSQELIITSNKGLREAAVEVFDRTFTITIALQILAGLVAFIGVLNTVMSLMLERSRELGILRAGGMTMRQLWKLVLVESGLIGLLAGLFAIPLGTAMAWILVFIINKRSFGWTLDFILQFETFWQAIAISVIAALMAGIYPAYKSATASVSELLRTE